MICLSITSADGPWVSCRRIKNGPRADKSLHDNSSLSCNKYCARSQSLLWRGRLITASYKKKRVNVAATQGSLPFGSNTSIDCLQGMLTTDRMVGRLFLQCGTLNHFGLAQPFAKFSSACIGLILGQLLNLCEPQNSKL